METHRTKILYVITKSNFGGAQRYVYELATSLPKDAFDVTVAFGGDGLLKQKLEAAKINTRAIPSFARDINLWREVLSLFELRGIIYELKPDIIHLNSSKAGGSGALIARICGVPRIIFTAHGWPFHEKRSVLWKSIVWALSWITTILAHATILVSEYDRHHTWMLGTGKKFQVIHTALPRINFLSPQTARQILHTPATIAAHAHDVWLVTTAELTPNKNLLTAIQAVAAHNAKSPVQKIFYTILGDGELSQLLRTYIAEHHLENQIYLAGYIPEARIYLKAFDMFLLPSHKEGMPYALLEAGAAGLPVIASNIGGIPEIITNDENGLLIDPKDQQSIETALQAYASDPTRRAAHARKLKVKVDSSFDLKTMIEKTMVIYNGTKIR